MASAPVFADTPRVGIGVLSIANTNRDGTGTIQTVIAGGSLGTMIRTVRIQAVGTTTAGMVRLYVYNGLTSYLIREAKVEARTPSGTADAWFTQFLFTGDDLLLLPSASWELQGSTNNAEVFNVIAIGADY